MLYNYLKERIGELEDFEEDKQDIKEWKGSEYKGNYKPKKFAIKVFNFLNQNKEKLGLEKIYEAKNCAIDGILVHKKNKVTMLEIKYGLSNYTACFAIKEFESFLTNKYYEDYRIKEPENGLIIFSEFSSKDWKKEGWRKFYDKRWNLVKFYCNKKIYKTKILELKETLEDKDGEIMKKSD